MTIRFLMQWVSRSCEWEDEHGMNDKVGISGGRQSWPLLGLTFRFPPRPSIRAWFALKVIETRLFLIHSHKTYEHNNLAPHSLTGPTLPKHRAKTASPCPWLIDAMSLQPQYGGSSEELRRTLCRPLEIKAHSFVLPS